MDKNVRPEDVWNVRDIATVRDLVWLEGTRSGRVGRAGHRQLLEKHCKTFTLGKVVICLQGLGKIASMLHMLF